MTNFTAMNLHKRHQQIQTASLEIHQLITELYSGTEPATLQRDLLKAKLIALYDLLQQQEQQPEFVTEETVELAMEHPIAVNDGQPDEPEQILPLLETQPEVLNLFNDIPPAPSEQVIEEPTLTPTELRNLEIDAILEKQEQDLPPVEPSIDQAERSLHEKIASSIPTSPALADKLGNSQLANLKNAINVNLKIAMVNTLFGENTVEYVKAIDKLNASENIHEAMRYFTELKLNYNWDNEHTLVKELEQLIQKRFA
ncbi:MAG: hypothetical protein MUE96_01970 [Bacteroidia bacterium]|jgi:hypothetical protein|nr:hypothetical protein [Bacteroidia bacterium]